MYASHSRYSQQRSYTRSYNEKRQVGVHVDQLKLISNVSGNELINAIITDKTLTDWVAAVLALLNTFSLVFNCINGSKLT